MKRELRITILWALLLFVNSVSFAQSKSETKAYNSAVKKATVKAYDSFLNKYPESTFFTEILTLRDTKLFSDVDTTDVLAVEAFVDAHQETPLMERIETIIDRLNISPIDYQTAESIFGESQSLDGKDLSFHALGYRSHGVDMILGVVLRENVNPMLTNLVKDDDNWAPSDGILLPDNSVLGEPEQIYFADGFEIVKIQSNRYLQFCTVNYHNGGTKVEYVAHVFDIENQQDYTGSFYGNNLQYPNITSDYLIEGQDPSSLSTGLVLAEEIYLKNLVASNEKLTLISEENLKVDNAIEWWYSKNPKAETSAKSLSFGLLDVDNGIVKKFSSSPKESSGHYRVALFDYRGQTMICAYNTTTKEYSLVWCEPVAQDKNRDKLLNTIYFEKDSNLVMFYYKGKTTFKIRVNLANKSIRR